LEQKLLKGQTGQRDGQFCICHPFTHAHQPFSIKTTPNNVLIFALFFGFSVGRRKLFILLSIFQFFSYFAAQRIVRLYIASAFFIATTVVWTRLSSTTNAFFRRLGFGMNERQKLISRLSPWYLF